ncbi:MAG: FecR domain-containing protein [Pseudomonadota bacterium]
MIDHDQRQLEKRKRAEEAARILRRLDEDPDDAQALKDRDAFLTRGAAERRTYENIRRAMGAARQGLKAKDRRFSFAILGAALAAMALAWQPAQLAILADYRTQRVPETITLRSGDNVTLDASSALRDTTTDDARTVDLLRGAGFFDVAQDGRRFTVLAGGVEVEVIGTMFEVSVLPNGVLVGVAEGAVEVRRGGDVLQLGPGDEVVFAKGEANARKVPEDTIGRWRSDQLIMDGLTLAQVAATLDRRIRGEVVVVGQSLRNAEVAGGLDLNRPKDALRTLAATSGAQVVQATPYLTIVYPRQKN